MAHDPVQPNLRQESPSAFSRPFWVVLLLTGITAGLVGGLLMRLLFWVQQLAWGAADNQFSEGVSHSPVSAHLVNLLVAGTLVGASVFVLRRLGPGISEVNAAIWFNQGKLAVVKGAVQGLVSIVNVGLGMSLGREASIKQAGGVAASQFSQWLGVGPEERCQLVACGVGAGMAAAYNVPLGGALFAVEVLLGTFSLRIVVPALLASTLATATSWLLLPAAPIYVMSTSPLSASLCIWAAVVGPLLGVAAVVLVRAIGWAGALKPASGWRVWVAPMLVFVALGAVSLALPLLLGNGKDAVQLAITNRLSTRSLAILPEMKLLAVFACIAAGGTGGLFTPTMTIGALLGGLLGHGWELLWPGVSPGSCAVVGSCAVLAASTQGPLSSVALVLELTRHLDPTMVPVLLAVVGATLTARAIESQTVYTIRLPSGGKA